MRAHAVGTLLTWSLVGSLQTSDLRPQSPADQACRFFATLPVTTVESVLELIRPVPISAEEKERVLSDLPREGELRPTSSEAAKIASLRRVLIYHKREDVFEIKVIDLPQAEVVLHARSIVLISRPALRLVSPVELQAIVAHEVGHEYFWQEYERSSEQRDVGARHELELRCDAIAILTLLQLGLDPTSVVSAARKLTRFNAQFGTTDGTEQYPSTAEREQFTRAIVRAHERSAPR